MTEKQEQRLKNKILKIKKALAADKKRWGGYHDDSGGLRYAPPQFYMKLQDHKGALRYFNWFDKNFPDDSGAPDFLFEWTVTLFKRGRLKQAEKKALETFFSNPFLLDRFLGRERLLPFRTRMSDWQQEVLSTHFTYSHEQEELQDFALWLQEFMSGQKFNRITEEFLAIECKLTTEDVGPERSALISKRSTLLDDY